jgi:hypothetical protein
MLDMNRPIFFGFQETDCPIRGGNEDENQGLGTRSWELAVP